MNPLGALPASSSAGKSLNRVDWMKLVRMAIIQILSAFLTLGVPYLLGQMWVFGGHDYTPVVITLTPIVAEAIRRYLSNHGVQAPAPVNTTSSITSAQTAAASTSNGPQP
jgi:hypothetical protein